MSSKHYSNGELTELAAGLNRLARNLWWTWSQEAQDIFQSLSERGFRNLYHNAVAVLNELSEYELRVRLMDPGFRDRVKEVLARFEAYLGESQTWAEENAPELQKHPVAYFTAEFGFHETLPIAAGGLGVLAGDHVKTSSDLGVGLVGISLFYRQGYFQQGINHDNWQTEYYTVLDPKNLPMEAVLGAKGEPLILSVPMAASQVFFRVWRVNVGRNPVFLLDTNVPENEEGDRDLTLRVYGGDLSTRLKQELLLGVGGVKVLRALGIQPSVFHMNEGHSAFLTLELIRENIAAGMAFEDALKATRAVCLFTTHTPVEAGHDRFPADLLQFWAAKFFSQLQVPISSLIELGRVHPERKEEPFCMTVLALKVSRGANGVSELHGEVSRRMWQGLYPGTPVDQVPIGHVTNGIHVMGWMKGTVRRYWRNKVREDQEVLQGKGWDDWEKEVVKPEFWKRMEDPDFISDQEIWSLRYQLRRELIEFARRRLLLQGRMLGPGDFIAFDQLLRADALTIGFARRFATYKRAPLIFERFRDVVEMVKDQERPVQFIFAGKAHPKDQEGKRYIQKVIHLAKHSELEGHLVFLENYDIHVARMMVSGCDVWLNNPRRPLEASGTSGQKIGCHGGLNLSILDGWWREGYDGTNGFAIGDDSHPSSVEEQDERDSEALYRTLKEEVIPCFYDRDAQGIPRRWITRIRRAMSTLVPQFDTQRMLKEYVTRYYQVR